MRPALTSVHAPDQPGQQPPTLLQDLGTVVRLYGTVFWMLGQRLQRGQRWEQKLTAEALRTYGFSDSEDARTVVRHPN
ncbi:MAG: hypothetical protein IIA90_07275 [Chloroflexi bacterium]|nr:hypothetical protein [Chloroflexota bacterium]